MRSLLAVLFAVAGLPTIAIAASPGPLLAGVVGLAPFRLLDTRQGAATGDGVGAGGGRVQANGVVEVVTAGRGGAPVDAAVAVLNITAVDPTAAGFLTVWPCGSPRPNASTLNFSAGATVANLAFTVPGGAGKTCVFVSAATHLLADMSAYYPAGSAVVGVVPFRLVDTRPGATTGDGIGAGSGRVSALAQLEVVVAGRGTVPSGRTTVLNVTVGDPVDAGYITVWPCGSPRPTASTLNFIAGQTVANAAFTLPGTGGKTCVFTSAAAHVIVDVTGYYSSAVFAGLTPFRLADSRPGAPTGDGQGAGTGRIAAGGTLSVSVASRGGVNADPAAAVLNVTVTDPLSAGFLTAWPCGTPRPNASNLNFAAGQTIANAVLTTAGAGGATCLYTSAATHLIVDVTGYEARETTTVPPPSPQTSIAAGLFHSAVVKADGTVWTFGNNTHGELGRTTANAARSPTAGLVPGLSGVRMVAGGGQHTVALKTDGTVWTFGFNADGQLGRTTAQPSPNPTPGRVAVLNGITAVAANNDFTVALKSDGTVWTFGYNLSGQLGRSTPDFASTPVPGVVAGLSNVVAIAAGHAHTVALKADGTVWTFGNNQFGQLGRITTATSPNQAPGQVTGLSSVIAIAASNINTVVLRSDGTVWTFGANIDGQLGRTTPGDKNPNPGQVPNLTNVLAITAGDMHTAAVKSDGTVWTFGDNQYGQLGRPTAASSPNQTPGQVPGVSGVVAVAAGFGQTIALKSDGTRWSFGDNATGELGRATVDTFPNEVPGQVPGLGPVIAVAAGDGATAVLRSDGTVWTFGSNTGGELGRVTTVASPNPVPGQVPGLTEVSAIAAGYLHTATLRTDGTVWTFGRNFAGQLGRVTSGSITGGLVPAQVPGINNVTAVAAGSRHTVVLRVDGTVWTFGSNRSGQLGHGTTDTNPNPVPAQVVGISGVIAIAAGGDSTLVLRSDGTVWTFGDNGDGQLGRTTLGNVGATPGQVPGLSSIIAISEGFPQSIALDRDGVVWTFGGNNDGQLARLPIGTPNQAPTASGFGASTAIAGGFFHTLSLTPAGVVRSVGGNGSGELGRITANDTPNRVPGDVVGLNGVEFTGVATISAGDDMTIVVKVDGTVWSFGYNGSGQLGRNTPAAAPNSAPGQVLGLGG